jgi:hypothetical protein
MKVFVLRAAKEGSGADKVLRIHFCWEPVPRGTTGPSAKRFVMAPIVYAGLDSGILLAFDTRTGRELQSWSVVSLSKQGGGSTAGALVSRSSMGDSVVLVESVDEKVWSHSHWVTI